MFEDLKKQVEESQKRWDEIGKRANEVKNILEDPDVPPDMYAKNVAELVLLLVEQFKPMSKIDSEDFVKGILDAFTGGKIDDK